MASFTESYTDFRMILGVHLRTWFRGNSTKGIKGYVKLVFQALFIIGFAVGVWFGSKGLFGVLFEAVKPLPALADLFTLKILTALGLSNMILISMGTMNVVYSYLFESEDLAFLLSTPMNPRAIFGARLTESFLVCLLSVIPFGLIPAVAIGYVYGAAWPYYLIMVIGFAALIAIMLGVVSLLLLVIMRFVPGQRLKQIAMIGGLLIGLSIMFVTQMASYKSDMNSEQIRTMAQSISNLRLGDMWAFPHAWFAHAGMRALGADSTSYAATLLPLIVLGAVTVIVASLLSTTAYLTGWSSSIEVSGNARKAAKARETAMKKASKASRNPIFKGQFMGLVEKELLLFSREPVLWYNFVVGLVVVTFFMLNINNKDGSGQMPADFKRYFILFMLFFGASVGGTQLAGTAISREGDSWSILRSFPIKATLLFWSKAVSSGAPSMLLAVAGLITVTVLRIGDIDPFPIYVSLPICVAFITVLTMVVLSLDCLTPNFKYKLTTKKGTQGNGASGIKATIVSLGTMVYLVILAATISFPTFNKEISWFKGWGKFASQILSYSVFSLETVGVCTILYILAIKRLNALLSDQ